MVAITGLEVGLAVLGGLLISASSSVNMLARGRITGCSGMFYSVLTISDAKTLPWKLSFIGGMTFASSLICLCC
jgi:hypothetical protein